MFFYLGLNSWFYINKKWKNKIYSIFIEKEKCVVLFSFKFNRK